MMMKSFTRWLRSERGASAAEFALVLAPFLLLVFGVIHMSLMIYSIQQLNYAAEATARCMVVATNSGVSGATCSDSTSATSYFRARYHAPTTTPNLTTLNEAKTCNSNPKDPQVVATVNYVIKAAFFTRTVTLTANGCFPHT